MTFFPALINKGPQNNVIFFGGIVFWVIFSLLYSVIFTLWLTDFLDLWMQISSGSKIFFWILKVFGCRFPLGIGDFH